MKLPIAILAAFSVTASAAGTLTIKEGETFTVGQEQQRMMLDSLTIGDGARVRFAPGVTSWQLRAQTAAIGNGVVIEAAGSDGSDGADGKGYERGAKNCEDGVAGEDATGGSDGADGVSLRLQLGLTRFGSMKIGSSGGDGGNGGDGGKGQDAGEFSKACQNPPVGGDAGKGGNGGNGGNGGDVTVIYWPASEAVAGMDVVARIQVDAEAGHGGAAGAAGKAGAGSEGRYVKKRTLTSDRAFIGGGEKGAKADPGTSGASGLDGKVLVEQALVTAPAPVATPSATPPAATESDTPASQQEIKELKQTLKALMQRLDELEKQ